MHENYLANFSFKYIRANCTETEIMDQINFINFAST